MGDGGYCGRRLLPRRLEGVVKRAPAMPAYPLYLSLHVIAGTVALITFWSAAALRKGGPAHRRCGQAYLLAMAAVIVSGIPLTVQRWIEGQLVAAAFLAYLLVITATGVWTAWRAIRDQRDVVRYTGPAFMGFALASMLSGIGVLVLGLRLGAPLLIGFSAAGVLGGGGMLVKRLRRERLAARPRWWVVEHYSAMLGNGIATHIAFLLLGLPRLLPMIDGTVLHYASWFGPLVLAVIAKVVLDLRWKARRQLVPPRVVPGRRQTSPSSSQPSPVPRL